MPEKLVILTEDQLRSIIAEQVAPLEARLGRSAIQPRNDLVLPTKLARRYIGFTREMWDEALKLGFIRRLPVTGPRRAHLYDVRDLEVGGRRYLDFVKGRNGGDPETKAAAGVTAPARKE